MESRGFGATPMKLQRSNVFRLGLLAVLLLGMLANPALAREEEERLPPYDVNGMAHGKMWVPWVFAFLFSGGCMAIAFKNPHRSATERT
jgi:hypothetical protein